MPSKQVLFRNMLLGTLLYSVVIGFFNDYTDILNTRSYSITFALALLLQILTFFTFELKRFIIKKAKKLKGKKGKAVLVFGVWGTLFISKFVFLWAIGVVFGNAVYISGFMNIFYVVLVMTIAQKILIYIDQKLGSK
jgi:MFS family permease